MEIKLKLPGGGHHSRFVIQQLVAEGLYQTETDVMGEDATTIVQSLQSYLKGLRKSNIEELRQGISLTKLPKTFQDAVAVARCFKVSYLWIGSLRILQDSNSKNLPQ